MLTDEFEDFLRSVGLVLEMRRGPERESFGNWIIQYGGGNLAVSMVCDRQHLNVYIADKHHLSQPSQLLPPSPVEYDVDLIREVISGAISDPMDYAAQKAFVREHWNEIFDLLTGDHRHATHERLQFLAHERMKRTFDPWPTAILEFETFLQGKGLACQKREAPDGMMGTRIMQYAGTRVNVKMESTDGWRLLFADAAGPADTWYDIRSAKDALTDNHPQALRFQEWFTFAAEHWEDICAMFEESRRQATHQRLALLEEQTRKRRAEIRVQQMASIQALEDQIRDQSKPS